MCIMYACIKFVTRSFSSRRNRVKPATRSKHTFSLSASPVQLYAFPPATRNYHSIGEHRSAAKLKQTRSGRVHPRFDALPLYRPNKTFTPYYNVNRRVSPRCLLWPGLALPPPPHRGTIPRRRERGRRIETNRISSLELNLVEELERRIKKGRGKNVEYVCHGRIALYFFFQIPSRIAH